jgi:hypothetical protein
VAQGNKVAVTVDAFLKGQSVVTPRFITDHHDVPQIFLIEEYAEAKRPLMPELPVEARLRSLAEVELGLGENAAREECKRCLRCDLEWLGTMKNQSAGEPQDYIMEETHLTR